MGCFPDTVKVKLDSLSEKLSQANLQMNNLQGAQKLHIQKVELDKAMEAANTKLLIAETRMDEFEQENKRMENHMKWHEERRELIEENLRNMQIARTEKEKKMRQDHAQEK